MKRSQIIPNMRRDQFWREAVARRGDKAAFASALTNLRPDSMDAARYGNPASAVFESGVRVYVFPSQSDRDRFLTDYRRVYSAKPCGNPCA